jgi:hypothetical protein
MAGPSVTEGASVDLYQCTLRLSNERAGEPPWEHRSRHNLLFFFSFYPSQTAASRTSPRGGVLPWPILKCVEMSKNDIPSMNGVRLLA